LWLQQLLRAVLWLRHRLLFLVGWNGELPAQMLLEALRILLLLWPRAQLHFETVPLRWLQW